LASSLSNDHASSLGDADDRASRVERRLYLSALALFLVAAGLTLMSTRMMTGAMPMPGGWTMGMVWMRMPGQSWLAAGGMFGAMWLAMMVAMMLPSSFPMLRLYRRLVIVRGEPRADLLVWVMAAGYFFVWTVFGIVAYAAGAVIAETAMRSVWISRVIPIVAGAMLIAAGIYQLTPWKAACLTHCRSPLGLLSHYGQRRGWRGAMAMGLHHGLFCTGCCWALMMMQLVLGVMNVAAMIAVATIIALEKLAPGGATLARSVGAASIVGGMWLVARVLVQ
jgi:predicted metal-binding membrane protein